MKVRHIISFILAILVVVAAWKVSDDKAPTTEVTTAKLFPALFDRINDIQALNISTKDTVTKLAKRDNTWVVANRDDFPADVSAIKSTLINIADLTVIEQKTSKPENYARIDVAGIDQEESKSVLVDVLDGADAQLASLIVGKKRTGGALGSQNYYVRKSDSATALLVEGALDIGTTPKDWMDTEIVDIPTERIRQVKITRGDETPILVTKAQRKDNFFSLDTVPTGFEAKSRAVVSGFGAMLQGISFDDVAAAAKTATAEKISSAEIQTFDGLVATLDQFRINDEPYIRFNFSYDADIVVSEPPPPTPDDESEPNDEESVGEQDDAANAPLAVDQEVADLQAKVAAWVYRLPDYKTRLLDKRFDDLIKAAEPEEKAEPSN